MNKKSPDNNDTQSNVNRVGIIVILLICLVLPAWIINSIFYQNNVSTPAVAQCNSVPETPMKPEPIPPLMWKNTGLISIWMDDGWKTQYSEGFRIMEQEHMPGAIAVVTGAVCFPAFVTWDNLRTMQSKGWETTSHTVSHHCDFAYYNASNTRYELEASKKAMLKQGLRADQFVMPCGYDKEFFANVYGDKDSPMFPQVQKFYQSYRTTLSKRVNTIPVSDPYNLKAFPIKKDTTLDEVTIAIENARAQRGWLIIIFHQIDNSGQNFAVSPEKFKQIIRLIKDSDLPVVLPSQVLSIKK